MLFLLCIFLVYFNYYEHNYSALRYFHMQENHSYKVVLCHRGTFGGTTRLHGLACHDPDYINVPANSPVRAALQHHKRLARPPSRPVHASASAYNEEDNLLVRNDL